MQEGKPGTRRRWLLVPGLALLVLGLALSGWIGWQYIGTNVMSHRHQHEAATKLEAAWHSGQQTVKTPWGKAVAIVRIPRFGADYRVPLFQGVNETVLASGFGHYAHTVGPGQVGNYAIAAHRVTHGEPLRDMPELRRGDKVIIETATASYTYRLLNGGDSLVVPDTAGWILDTLPKNPNRGGIQPPQHAGERLLTMDTCAELFHTTNREVVFGVLSAVHVRGGSSHA